MKEDMNRSDHASENASKTQLFGFLLTNGEGSSSSQVCNSSLQNEGELRPVKVRRKMIDLQLPAEEYLDMEETGANGLLADLNWQESEAVALSRDIYGRNNADAQGQNGHDQSSQRRDQLHLPSHSVPVLSINSFQPPSYDHSKVKRAYHRELEVGSRNAPSLHNDYRRHDFVRPWENPRSTHARAGSKETFFSITSAGFKPAASSGEVVKHQSFEGPKKQDCSAGLPWLKPKSPCQSGFSTGCLDLKDETYILKTVSPHKASCSNNGNLGRVERTDTQQSSRNNILGFQLFGASVSANVRHYIDLNSSASEGDEGYSSLHSNSMNELIKVAAQALVAISSCDHHQHHPDDAASSSTNAKDPLSWFSQVINSCSERAMEFDDFEDMTLKLQETKEEDYMPEPLVPDHLILERTDCNRLRRGQARRGRAKRDFQRDFLPGISSLSRLEVTEDIQMFGGLLKTAVGVEDSKLTRWEKQTRRPRRQSCPPSTFILT